MPDPGRLPEGVVLVRRLFTGVNASDVNFTSGRYFGSAKEARSQLPFDAGIPTMVRPRDGREGRKGGGVCDADAACLIALIPGP